MSTYVVAYLHPGEVAHNFHKSCRDLMNHDLLNKQRLRGFIDIECGSGRITDSRNQAVRKFLSVSTADWLVFIDADMGFEPDAVDRIIDAAHPTDRPMVGGLCFGQRKEGAGPGNSRVYVPVPTLYRWYDVDDTCGFAPDYEYPTDQLVEVDGTGAAFFCVHRTVLEGLATKFPEPRPWFDETIYKGQVFGEDLTFCRRVQESGHSIHVHTGVSISHRKSTYLEESLLKVDVLKVPTHVVIPFKNRADLTRPLLDELTAQGGYDHIWLYDNGSNAKTKNWLRTLGREDVTVIDAEGWNIHEMWNDGIDRATAAAARVNVAILNNDIKCGPDMLATLAKAMRADPLLSVVCPNYDSRDGTGVHLVQDICAGRYDGTGGLAGFAFMIRGEAGYRFPTELQWWGGDNHLVATAVKAGAKVGIVLDASVEHIDGGSQTGDWDAMSDVLQADLEAMRQLIA